MNDAIDDTKEGLKDLDFFADIEVARDLPGYLSAMRSKCPVYQEPFHDVFMVTGMEEAMQVFQHQADAFSSCVAVTGPIPPLPFTPGDDVRRQIREHRHEMPWAEHLAALDGEEHAARRAMLAHLLTHSRLKANEDYVYSLVERLVDGLIDRGGCEITRDFAHALSTLVIADLLGVPEDDRQSLLDAMDPDPTQMDGDQDFKLGPDPLVHLHDRFRGYLEDRLAHPRDDMLTGLANATFKDGTDPGLTVKAQLASFLFGAGQDTSARLVAFAFRVLGDLPQVQAKLRSDPACIPQFVEEVLRFEPPVKTLSRLALRDVEIGATEVPKGAIVTVCTGGVNRDPRHFDDPDSFELNRTNARDHVSFSRGSHACIGAPLARMEVRVALERFLDKTSDIRISEQHHGPLGSRKYSYEPTYLLHGLQELHVEWSPR